MRRWVIWAPVVMVASLVYWTVALGLGGLSLMAAGAMSTMTETMILEPEVPPSGQYDQSFEPIVVHLEEWAEPEDSDAVAPGCGSEPSAGDDVGHSDEQSAGDAASGPGQTAF